MLDLNAMRTAKAEVREWLRTDTMATPTVDRIVERACVAYASARPADDSPMKNDMTTIAPTSA